jgi:hypothetical protein
MAVRIAVASIPTTLEGPFQPVTVQFDPSLRQGSSDLPQNDSRIAKQVTGNYPEQIALALSTPDAMWITWITGNAQLALQVVPLDPTTVASVVQYGTKSGNYSLSAVGTSLVYNQLYPFPGLLNYTSGIIHHVHLTGSSASQLANFLVLEQTVKINYVDSQSSYGEYQVAFSDMILCGTIHYCEQAQATFDGL